MPGVVGRYLLNVFGEVDGLILADGLFVLYAPCGEIRGAVLEDGSQFLIPVRPPESNQFGLQAGASVDLKGYGTSNAFGTCLEATELSVTSKRSLIGLDGLNFTMADVRDGVGPFLSIYLKGSQHWPAGQIGIAMAVSSIAAAACQIPAGLIVDSIRAKRALVAGSGFLVAVGCLSLALIPNFYCVMAAQTILGAASAIIPPSLAALSLGLVGRQMFPARVSRNEGFNHAGNFSAALLAGTVGQRLGYHWIIYFVCLFAIASAFIVSIINPREPDLDVSFQRCDGPDLDPDRLCPGH
jgi:Major Facilitator Superfamily